MLLGLAMIETDQALVLFLLQEKKDITRELQKDDHTAGRRGHTDSADVGILSRGHFKQRL